MNIRNQPRRSGCAVVMMLMVLVGPACSEGAPVTGNPFEDPTVGGSTGVTSGVVDPTESVDTTAGDGSASTSVADTTAGEDTTTGGEMTVPGQTQTQLVTAGQHSASANYSLVFTIGQPSQLQSTHASANYRMQGGLVGANGSPP